MDVTLDVIFACKFFSDVILHVISDMHGERARCARRKFDMNFTHIYDTHHFQILHGCDSRCEKSNHFCMDVNQM